MSVQAVLDDIAYISWHGIRVVEERIGWARLRMPARNDLVNHVGSSHGGAMFTLAETAAGVAADSLAQTLDAYILLRQAKVIYSRQARGELVATGSPTPQASSDGKQRFTETGRSDLPVAVVIRDSDNQPVFEGTFDFVLRPRQS